MKCTVCDKLGIIKGYGYARKLNNKELKWSLRLEVYRAEEDMGIYELYHKTPIFKISLSLQPDGVNLWYLKLRNIRFQNLLGY